VSLSHQFKQDNQGKKFHDVLSDPRIDFEKVAINFFEDPARQQRMIDSEQHHARPALAGVVKEFESQPDVDAFFKKNDAHTTVRFRQAIGVLVKIVMRNNGWKTTGHKGSLGNRIKVSAHTTIPGAYRNNSGGLSTWFNRTERYAK